jgi:hypothetical protein
MKLQNTHFSVQILLSNKLAGMEHCLRQRTIRILEMNLHVAAALIPRNS